MDVPLGEAILRNHGQRGIGVSQTTPAFAAKYGHGYIPRMRSISAGKFKDTCLRVLDEVAANRAPVTVTKWGRPVARLVPVVAPLTAEAPAEPGPTGVEERVQPYGSDAAVAAPEAPTERLHRLAEELGLSPDEVLHQALIAYRGGTALDELVERARRPVGAFRSGRGDLAESHDDAWGEILEEEMERWRLPE